MQKGNSKELSVRLTNSWDKENKYVKDIKKKQNYLSVKTSWMKRHRKIIYANPTFD